MCLLLEADCLQYSRATCWVDPFRTVMSIVDEDRPAMCEVAIFCGRYFDIKARAHLCLMTLTVAAFLWTQVTHLQGPGIVALAWLLMDNSHHLCY